jgi:hypothetical protein
MNKNKSSMKFLQKKNDVKATMKNFELQGKADFFGKGLIG